MSEFDLSNQPRISYAPEEITTPTRYLPDETTYPDIRKIYFWALMAFVVYKIFTAPVKLPRGKQNPRVRKNPPLTAEWLRYISDRINVVSKDKPSQLLSETIKGIIETEPFDSQQKEFMITLLQDAKAHERSGDMPSSKKKNAAKPFKTNYIDDKYGMSTWIERDRAHIALYNLTNDEMVIEWWDDDVKSMVNDGFLKPKDWKGSAIDYALQIGMIEKEKRPKPRLV